MSFDSTCVPPLITAAILVIGNEILSGRTQDTNVAFIAKHLQKKGIKLQEVRIVPDHEQAIIDAVLSLKSIYTYVFTTGGIGATHDDITAASIAKAFHLDLVVHEDALQRLKDHYQERLNANRSRMALLPATCQLIDNAISAAPGFSLDNVYCMAGMPNVMQAMFLWLLPHLKGGNEIFSSSVTCNLMEGDIAHALAFLQSDHPNVDIGSYPFYRIPPDIGVTFVLQSDDKMALSCAFQGVLKMIDDFNGTVATIH